MPQNNHPLTEDQIYSDQNFSPITLDPGAYEDDSFFDNVGDWFDNLFDIELNLWGNREDKEAIWEGDRMIVVDRNLEELTDFFQKGYKIWSDIEDRKSPFYNVGIFFGKIFDGLTNRIKSFGEPTIPETIKYVAFIYALTYAYTNIARPPRRTYSYKNYPIKFSKSKSGWSYGTNIYRGKK